MNIQNIIEKGVIFHHTVRSTAIHFPPTATGQTLADSGASPTNAERSDPKTESPACAGSPNGCSIS